MYFIKNYGQQYDALRYELGEEKAFCMYAKQKHRLILVEAREDNATRLFIRSLYAMEDHERKNGWWNTFTICNEPQEAGMYIAEIEDVRQDKNGYPMFIARPFTNLNIFDSCISDTGDPFKDAIASMRRRNTMWGLFLESGCFTEHYTGWMTGVNHAAVCRKFELPESCDRTGLYQTVVHTVVNGSADLKEILDLLLSPTDSEILRANRKARLQDFFDNRNSHNEEYPNLVKKLNRLAELNGERTTRSGMENIMFGFTDKHDYEVAVGHMEASESEDELDKAEAYLKFDAERKAKNKKKKGDAKKANKKNG